MSALQKKDQQWEKSSLWSVLGRGMSGGLVWKMKRQPYVNIPVRDNDKLQKNCHLILGTVGGFGMCISQRKMTHMKNIWLVYRPEKYNTHEEQHGTRTDSIHATICKVTYWICDVIHNNGCLGTSVIHWGQTVVPLLSSRVPDLKFDCRIIQTHSLCQKCSWKDYISTLIILSMTVQFSSESSWAIGGT